MSDRMRFDSDTLLVRSLAALVLVALWGAVMVTIVNPAVAGLEPGHGHLSMNGAVPPHEHSLVAHDQLDATGDSLVFTLDRDGSVASSVDVPAAFAPIAPPLGEVLVGASELRLEGTATPPIERPPTL